MNNLDLQEDLINSIKLLDAKLSKRQIELDPKGYFLIKIEPKTNELILEHYLNDIDQKGRAIDPKSGEPIGCKTKSRNQPNNIYRGKSAKHLGIQISEGHGPFPISHLDHAIYIGRELQRAEQCLITGKQYIQD
jgi:dihydropteroate synthase